MFVGQTRFSIYNPGSGAWKSSAKTDKGSSDSFAEYLYSESRLAPRATIFFEHSLPMLMRAAESHSLMHIVSYSSNLPERYRDKLLAVTDANPFIYLDEKVPGEPATSWTELVPTEVAVGDIVGAYRLDDDDLLASDFFDRMASYLKPAFEGMWVSFANGYTAVLNDGVIVNPRQLTWPKIAIGLTGIYRRESEDSFSGPSLRGGHNRADRHSPVILDSRHPSFLWLRSAGQDSLVNVPEDERESTLLDQLKEYDFADETLFRTLFPNLARVVFPRSFNFQGSRTISEDPQRFEFDVPARKFAIKYSYRCDNVVDHRHYLLKFDLHAKATELGQDKGGKNDAPKIQGISYSPNPKVGFFKYLPLRRGRGEGRVSIDLPSDFECHGIEIQEWKKPRTPLLLESLQVEVEE